MIVVRDDDVLLRSSGHHNSFKRFKRVHEIICKVPTRLLHVPTILTEEIQDFPEAVDYIQFETKYGRMRPELHGYQHVDYGAMTKAEIIDQLEKAFDWFVDTLGYRPNKWYTPWGASQPHLHEVAKDLGLKLVDCSKTHKLKGRYGVKQLLADGQSTSYFEGQEIIMHWWSAIDNERIAEFVEVLLNEARTTH